MHMTFWFGSDLGDFFIKGFKISSTSSFVLVCFCLFLLSVLVEGLKVHKTRSRAKAAREKSRSLSCSPSENATLLSLETTKRPLVMDILEGVKEVSIFIFHNCVNYGLMLAVMLFNAYIFIAVVLGAFVGYFLFGHLSVKTNMENLQAIRTKLICSTRCADSEEPCTSGTTPIISHCPTIVGEGSGSGVNVLRNMRATNSEDSSEGSESSTAQISNHPCH